MHQATSEFRNMADGLNFTNLENCLVSLEGELNTEKMTSKKLAAIYNEIKAKYDITQSSDRMTLEKASMNMRRHHKKKIDPLHEKIAYVKLVLDTKFGRKF